MQHLKKRMMNGIYKVIWIEKAHHHKKEDVQMGKSSIHH